MNWQKRTGKRAEPVNQVEIIVPHPYDLIISKLSVGCPKDFAFAVAVVRLFPKNAVNIVADHFRDVTKMVGIDLLN